MRAIEAVTPRRARRRRCVRAWASPGRPSIAIGLAHVVPTSLAPQRLYNVDEALAPAILDSLDSLDAARRLRYLRCRRDLRVAERWPGLLAQARTAGRIITREGSGWIAKAARTDSTATSNRST